MKAWIMLVMKRLGRVVTEMISVKTVIAWIVTAIYLKDTATLGIAGFMALVVLWCLVVGTRYAEKAKYLITGAKKEG